MASPVDLHRNGVADREVLTVEVEMLGDVAIARARGELDLATVDALRGALESIRQAPRLVLDLSGVRFIDSSGMHLLDALDRRAKRDGVQLSLIAPPPPVDRPLRLCGLDRALPFVSEVRADAA